MRKKTCETKRLLELIKNLRRFNIVQRVDNCFLLRFIKTVYYHTKDAITIIIISWPPASHPPAIRFARGHYYSVLIEIPLFVQSYDC